MDTFNGATSWAFNTPQTAVASITSIQSNLIRLGGYNKNALKPRTVQYDPKPITVNMLDRIKFDRTGDVTAKLVSQPLHKYTSYNKNYLKAKPGTYQLEPKQTPWTEEAALSILKGVPLGTPGIPTLIKPTEQPLEDKLKFLLTADKSNYDMWKRYLKEVQSIKLYVTKYPIKELMKAELEKIRNAVQDRFDEAQDGTTPFDATGFNENANETNTAIQSGRDYEKEYGPGYDFDLSEFDDILAENPGVPVSKVKAKAKAKTEAKTEAKVKAAEEDEDEDEDEGEDEGDVEVMDIPKKDITRIQNNNKQNNKDSTNIPVAAWKYIAELAGINIGRANKNEYVNAVLEETNNNRAVNLFVQSIMSGVINSGNTPIGKTLTFDEKNYINKKMGL